MQGPVKNEEDILEIITRIDSISSINFNLYDICKKNWTYLWNYWTNFVFWIYVFHLHIILINKKILLKES